MHTNVRFEHQLLAVESEHTVNGMLELQALSAPEDRPRPPLHIALVIDRSGSMAGPKLDVIRECAAFLVRRLAPTDELALGHLRPERQPARSPRARRPDSAPAEDRHDPPGRSDEPVRRVAEGRRGARPLGRRGPAEGPRAHRRSGQRRRHRRRLARGDDARAGRGVERRHDDDRVRRGPRRGPAHLDGRRRPRERRTTPPRRMRLPRSSRASSRG